MGDNLLVYWNSLQSRQGGTGNALAVAVQQDQAESALPAESQLLSTCKKPSKKNDPNYIKPIDQYLL